MFVKYIDFIPYMVYILCKGISNNCSDESGGIHMNNEEYKKYIMEMLTKIDDNQHLKRIFNYVHKYFIRRTGK